MADTSSGRPVSGGRGRGARGGSHGDPARAVLVLLLHAEIPNEPGADAAPEQVCFPLTRQLKPISGHINIMPKSEHKAG
jgi:hypothetical protein